MWKLFTRDGAEKQQLATPPSVVNPVARVIVPTAVVTNGVWTFLAYSTEEIDTDNMVDLVAQSRRITIQHSGKYLVSATTTWAANATGGRGVRFVKNGVTLYDGSGMEGGSISGFGPSSSAIVDCVAGDYLEMQVYQSSGGTINLGVSTFQAVKVDGAVVSYVGVPGNLVGQELDYAQIVAPVNIASTTEATGTPIITSNPITVDGNTPINIEFSAPYVISPSVAGNSLVIGIFEGVTQIARLCQVLSPSAANMIIPVERKLRFTPPAGTHTYSITAFAQSLTGTPSVGAGNGGTGGTGNPPAYLRITRAA